jgi:hypothetical protein
MSWQPIETIPVDGRAVLIYYRTSKTVGWLGRADDWRAKPYWLENVTHWMPLPEPPENAK